MFNVNGRLASLKEMAIAWLEKEHTGAMVALFVPPDVAQRLAIPGGLPPEELHVSLAYLGEANQIQDVGAIQRYLARFAGTHSPIKVKVGGIGKFSKVNSDGKQAFYLSVDSPDLPEFRQGVIDGLVKIAPVDQEHGFTPHMTLKYVKENSGLPLRNADDVEFTFDNISLGLGGVYYHYPLGSSNKMDTNKVLKVNGFEVTLGDLAAAWLSKAERFTNVPWSSPESDLSPADYAKVCLINLNESGTDEPVKSKMKLPVRSIPGGPVNRNALRAAAAALGGARGGLDAPAEDKRKAARTLVRLMREADIEVGDSLLSIAGDRQEGEKAEDVTKADLSWECEIVKADDEKRLIYGAVLVPDTVDLQNDKVSADEIEKAAHEFMVKRRTIDLYHKEDLPKDRAVPVESWLAPVPIKLGEKEYPKGTWFMTTWVPDDEIWKSVKDGKIRSYSIKGYGQRRPIKPGG